MGRGIFSGIWLGGLASALALAAVSLIAPPPPPAVQGQRDAAPVAAAELAAADAAPPALAPAAPVSETPPTGPAAEAQPATAAPGMVEVPPGSEFARGATDQEPAAPAVQPAPTPQSAPVVATPATESAPVLADTGSAARPEMAPPPADQPRAPQSQEAALRDAPRAEQPVPVPPPGEVETPVLAPVPAEAPDVAALPVPGPAPQGGPAASADEPVAMPQTDAPAPAAPETEAEPAPAEPAAAAPGQNTAEREPAPPGVSDRPAAGFSNARGVTVNRLPRIGETPVSPTPDAAAPDAAAPDAPAPATDPAEPAEPLPPVEAFALPFIAPEGAALYAVVLVDPGTVAGGLDRDTLKTIRFPLTIAIDPSRADAAEAAADYRAAGFEVAMLATPLPAGATAADLEVTFEAWHAAVPEAVALIEPAAPVFQNNRAQAQQLGKILAREGLALVTQDQGLNAGHQVAQKEALARALVWRVLDTGRDKAPAIQRYLERASFEAGRGQSVVVMLHAWPESVAGLLAWQPDEGARVTLAPVSAVARAAR